MLIDIYMSIVNKKEDISTKKHVNAEKVTYGIVRQAKFKRQTGRTYKVCAPLKVLLNFLKFVVCNPCVISPSLTILIPLGFIIIALGFFV